MQYAFKAHEGNFREWRQAGFPGIPAKGQEFLRHIGSPAFAPTLWKHQREAIERSVYAFEVLGKKDLLTNIVTGGGKTTIIGGMIAYLVQVHDVRQHLVITPNLIVRERLHDAFKANDPGNVFTVFPFFFGAEADWPKRLSTHVLGSGRDAAGIRAANIVIGNVHQLYEGTDNWRVVAENCDRLAIYNDEAHNTRAENYNDLINKLRPKRVFRLDTTATPDRLDGLHPDSEMIYVYTIREAMADRVVKRVIVYEPEIEKVKFTYYDWESKKEISAEEVPWAEIEARKVPAVRYTMNPEPMAQQISIALECLKAQRQGVPPGPDGKPLYKPLLFVVALNIIDAENIARTLREQSLGGERLQVLLIHSDSEDEAKEEAMSINKDIRNSKYDAIVSVMMLREGWDVKNISAILLFRKFSFTQMGDQVFSVYGPQIIGRGLRRVNAHGRDWERCDVIDHPIFKHDWLWEMLSAERYSGALNPGDAIDESKIPKPKEQAELDLDGDEPKRPEPFDLSGLPPIPEPDEELQPIADWRAFLDDYRYDFRGQVIDQTISQVLSRNLDSGHDTLDAAPLPNIDPTELRVTMPDDAGEALTRLLRDVRELARSALLQYDGQADTRQEILLRVLHEHLSRRFTGGAKLREVTDRAVIGMVWHVMPQVKSNFYNPALVKAILAAPPGEGDAEQARQTFEPA
ncbi:MAG: DEAD/DEAH box helicase [Dehalococcoidia bacterium]